MDEVFDRARLGVHREVVADVIAPVAQRRGVEGKEPQAVDAEPLEVVELGDQAGDVAHAVVVAVEEAPDEHLVEHGPLEPQRVVGRIGERQPPGGDVVGQTLEGGQAPDARRGRVGGQILDDVRRHVQEAGAAGIDSPTPATDGFRPGGGGPCLPPFAHQRALFAVVTSHDLELSSHVRANGRNRVPKLPVAFLLPTTTMGPRSGSAPVGAGS